MAKKPKKPKKSKPKKRKKRSRPRATRPVFEKRPKIKKGEAPPEFTITPGKMTQEEAYAVIEARLQDALAALPEGLHGRIIIHPYADGSVDGELYVTVGEADSREVEWDLYDSFTNIAVGQRYWISVGARYTIEADDEIYRRFRGMNMVQTNYQRANAANIAEEHLILRRKIIPGMEKRYKREAHSVFIRLHWNPDNEQPKR